MVKESGQGVMEGRFDFPPVEMFLPMFNFFITNDSRTIFGILRSDRSHFPDNSNVHTQIVERMWGQQNGAIGSIVDAPWGPRRFLLRHFAVPTFTSGVAWKMGSSNRKVPKMVLESFLIKN